MPLYRLFRPKYQNPDLARTQAVFIIMILIVLALVLPPLLSSLHNDTVQNLITNIIISVISFSVVKEVVQTAMSSAIEDHVKRNSSDEICKKQNSEFNQIVSSLERNKQSSEMKRKIAGDLIVSTLGSNDELLKQIALRTCLKELKMENASEDEIIASSDLTIFRFDIYIYLRAWLIQSIKHERIMAIEKIKQRYHSESNPDKSAYIHVFESIKDTYMKKQSFKSRFPEKYIGEVNEILDDYMGRLIGEIRNYNQTNTPRLP